MIIKIKNGKILDPATHMFIKGDLWIENERIVPPQQACDQEIDAREAYLMPGLVDLHIHGSVGVNFSKDPDYSKALDFCAKNGITTVFPTIGVHPLEELLQAIHTATEQIDRHACAMIGGIHLEGPFINANKKGAMNTPDIPCTIDNFDRIIKAGAVRIMTIAPERENALEVIRRGAMQGIRMSIGHTEADYSTAMAAIGAGATGATHTFNAMPSFEHRTPGTLGAVLTDGRIFCEVICDGVHLHPATIQLIRQCKGLERMILVSDSGMITGLGDGEFLVDGKLRIVKNKISHNPEGKLAGSCYTMADGARKLLKLGFTLAEIAILGAENPAKATGLFQELGSLEYGKLANLLFCDKDFNIQKVYIKGEQYV